MIIDVGVLGSSLKYLARQFMLKQERWIFVSFRMDTTYTTKTLLLSSRATVVNFSHWKVSFTWWSAAVWFLQTSFLQTICPYSWRWKTMLALANQKSSKKIKPFLAWPGAKKTCYGSWGYCGCHGHYSHYGYWNSHGFFLIFWDLNRVSNTKNMFQSSKELQSLK